MNPETLSRLSDADLARLADRMGLNLPEGLDRLFVIEEIFEALDDERQERPSDREGPGHVEEKKYSGSYEPISIPTEKSQEPFYNETMIRAIPRDPSWAFAYWDISEKLREDCMADDAEKGLFLRVSEFTDSKDHRRHAYFDIPIAQDDRQWYINLPHPGARYRIDLCIHTALKSTTLAKSNDILLPVQYMEEDTAHLPRSTRRLLILSGSDELNIAAPVQKNPSRIMPDADETGQ